MKGRKPPEIERDMISIGLDPDTAKKVAEASELWGSDAEKFKIKNYKLVNLASEQEMKLLILKVPEYEDIVKLNVKVKLYQHQYDALVCYAYNAGGGHTRVYKLLNKGKLVEAMVAMRKPNTSGGKFVKNLDDRRKEEIALYMYKNYGRIRG
jgi:GH24 family phage-related lysozyme (muramidase)